MTTSELIQANRDVLDVLLRQPAIEPSRIVHHAAAAAHNDLLVTYGPVAATDAQKAGAHRQAAETLRVVLQHTDRLDLITRAGILTRRGSNTAVDHIEVLGEAIAQLPAAYRRKLLITCDGAGATLWGSRTLPRCLTSGFMLPLRTR